jgi:large subunit ribosomal protein L20
MPRVKRGRSHIKRRKKLKKAIKGYVGKKGSTVKLGRQATIKAGAQSYRDRRRKKRSARTAWNIKIGAGLKEHNLPYNQFIHLLSEKKIALDRKILAQLVKENPELFAKIVKEVKK